MRVIGGRAKGHHLFSPQGMAIRPTLDRVRESLFNQLGGDIEGARFLDLFAGTGAVGIEALSRGAAHVVFVEINSKAQNLIYKNLKKCRFFPEDDGTEKNWFLLKSNALHALKVLEQRDCRFDIVYLDPPFDGDLYAETLDALARSSLLKETALVIAEHFHKNTLLANYGRLNQTKTRHLGDTCLSFYEVGTPG